MFSGIGCSFSTIRFFKDAIVVPSNATLARWPLLGAYTLHFEPSTNRAGSGTPGWLGLGLTSVDRGASAIVLLATLVVIIVIIQGAR